MVPRPDADDLAAEYASARVRIREVVHGGDPASSGDAMVPACPAWSVRDLLAHLAGVPAALVARRNPGADVQAWIDGHLAERAGRSVTELCDEWDEVSPRFEELIAAKPAAFGGLVYDVVAHEHDLRGALARPGGRDASGVTASLWLGMDLLASDLAAHGLPAVSVTTEHGELLAGEGEPGITLAATAWEAMRLLGSRRTAHEVLSAAWSGPDAGRVVDYMPALAHMALPERSLDE
jgi:hypothetical protein